MIKHIGAIALGLALAGPAFGQDRLPNTDLEPAEPIYSQVCVQSEWDFSKKLPTPIYSCRPIEMSCAAYEEANPQVHNYAYWRTTLDYLYGDSTSHLREVVRDLVPMLDAEGAVSLAKRRIIDSIYACVELEDH